MKIWSRVLFITAVLSGLASANQITLACISIGPANLNYWTTMACYTRSGAVELVALTLRQNAQDATPLNSTEDNRVVDTRTDLQQTMVPAAMIGGVAVYVPVSVASNSTRQNQGTTNQPSGSTGNSTGNVSNNTNPALANNSGGTAQASGGGGGGGGAVGDSNSSPLAQILTALEQDTTAQLFGSTTPAGGSLPKLAVNGDPFPVPGVAAAVPEPAAFFLSALGLTVLLYRAKRRAA